MYDKEMVRKAHFREGKSKSQIARDLDMNRRTVNKLLKMAPDEVPQYHLKKEKIRPALGAYLGIIQHCLDNHALPVIAHISAGLYAAVFEELGHPVLTSEQ